jgi:hypothetical protein
LRDDFAGFGDLLFGEDHGLPFMYMYTQPHTLCVKRGVTFADWFNSRDGIVEMGLASAVYLTWYFCRWRSP